MVGAFTWPRMSLHVPNPLNSGSSTGKSAKAARREMRKEVIVGLDIGTTKICAIIGEIATTTEPGEPLIVDIAGIGTAPSSGLRKGVVINIESTVESITKAIREAELMAGCQATSVHVGIAGAHIQSLNSHGVVAVKDKEITAHDVARVIDAAKALPIPTDREILHVIPQEFIIDGQDGIREPVGMSGVRLEAKVHIVTASASAIQNIAKCCNRAGLNVAEIVLEPIASAEAVLTEDEKECGPRTLVVVHPISPFTARAHRSYGSSAHWATTSPHIAVICTPQHEAEKIKRVSAGSPIS